MNQFKQYWEQLKPLERRWAVAGGCLIFLMLNYFFVWPHRHDWARDQARLQSAEEKIATYNKEVAKKQVYQTKLNLLQADGSQVVPEDQAIDFVHFYSSRMLSNHILLLNGGTLTTHTNQFFMEQQIGINVQADETNLVNFLYSLAAGNSMVRVRAMSLHPDPGHHELNAGVTMVASYQKKVVAHPATTTPAVTPVKNVTPPPVKQQPVAQTPARPAAPPPMMHPPGGVPPGPTNRIARFSLPGHTNKPPR